MQVILGTKIGMTQIIGETGVVTPVTILEAGPLTVTQIKTVETDGYNAVQVGYGQGRNLSKSVAGHTKKAGEATFTGLFVIEQWALPTVSISVSQESHAFALSVRLSPSAGSRLLPAALSLPR